MGVSITAGISGRKGYCTGHPVSAPGDLRKSLRKTLLLVTE